MAAILGKAWHGYQYVFEELTDPRTRSWFLVAKPHQGLAILGLYLMFVLKWGPEWMKNRKPFNLDKIMIVYNAVQVVLCAYIFINSIWYAWGWNYRWVCEPVDFSNNENALRIARFVHYYYMLKIIDLLDTVFFVLRKKNNQITFLHVYHHTGMVMLVWGAATYFPGGHGTLIGAINSFVHVVMYFYYLLTVAKPSVKNSITFKKTITQLQILQFFWCVVHMSLLVFKPDCEYPRWSAAVFLPQNLFMLILFIDFYIKTYIKKPAAAKSTITNGHKSDDNDHSGNNNTKNGSKKDFSKEIKYTNGSSEKGFKNGWKDSSIKTKSKDKVL